MGRGRAPLTPELIELERRMRELAAQQGGVATAAQCRGLGADRAALRRLVCPDRWAAVRRGTYADPLFRAWPARPDPAAEEFHRRCAALLAALPGPAVVSHGSAARLLGLPTPPGRPGPRIRITRRPPAPTNDPQRGDVCVRDYRDADVRVVAGVPVLAGARLVLDCAGTMPPESALAVADAALLRGLTTRAALDGEAARQRGRPGSRRAGLVVSRADPGGESWLESASRWWLLEAGLPAPLLQVRFADEAGSVRARVDLWFPDRRTVGEADGAGKYDEPGALYAEKRREDWLRDAHGVEVVRWGPVDIRTPRARAALVERFARAFARRS
ncbi:MAG: type IV toxin-antitoxin system AbiEi family antitoxin domain-containing protein [Pseudonocardiales bacterium]|nr:type IV toxin-antitoxin system AbiEi family antitoxin domain-containing protein [Pseudonocardiales bacterium]